MASQSNPMSMSPMSPMSPAYTSSPFSIREYMQSFSKNNPFLVRFANTDVYMYELECIKDASEFLTLKDFFESKPEIMRTYVRFVFRYFSIFSPSKLSGVIDDREISRLVDFGLKEVINVGDMFTLKTICDYMDLFVQLGWKPSCTLYSNLNLLDSVAYTRLKRLVDNRAIDQMKRVLIYSFLPNKYPLSEPKVFGIIRKFIRTPLDE